jgi:hypothetical protein
MKFFLHLLFALLPLLLSCSGDKQRVFQDGDTICLENDYALYSVGADGRNESFLCKKNGMDYLDHTVPGPFMKAFVGENSYPSTAVGLSDGRVEVDFGGCNVRVRVKINPARQWFIFEAEEIFGRPDSVRLVNLPIDIPGHFGAIINASYNKDFAVCVQAIDFNINSTPLTAGGESLFPADFVEAGRQYEPDPNQSKVLAATLYPELPVDGNPRVALLSCPGGDSLRESISNLELAFGMPHPTIAGQWGKLSDETKTSYLFIDFGVEELDEIIGYARAGGFSYICTNPFMTNGHYLIDTLQFPGGLETVRGAVARINAAGLKAGLHSNTGAVSFNDSYVTPVPDSRLAKIAEFELAGDIDPSSGIIPVTTSPEGMTNRRDYRIYGPGLHIQIGDEIISYSEYTTGPGFAFTGCARGECGTQAASHPRGSKVYYLAEKWRHFAPETGSTMMTEVSKRLAHVINFCGFDWLYLDGAEILASQGPSFYHVNSFAHDMFNRVDRDILAQASYNDNLMWHITSRVTSNDFAFYAIRRYLEVLRMDCIDLYRENFCPGELGWQGIYLNNPSHFARLPEEIEYGCVKTIAHDVGTSVQTSKGNLDGNGRIDEIMAVFCRYDSLRRVDYFPERIREHLRQPGADYKLHRDSNDGEWYFNRIKYGPESYVQLTNGSGQLCYTNEFSEQPLKIRIRAALAAASFDDPRNITLLDQPGIGRTEYETSDSLAASLEMSSELLQGKYRTFDLAAVNKSSSTSDWSSHTLYYDQPQDLSANRMLGAWVRGDNSGALLNLHLGIPRGMTTDQYVDLDFMGWRYFLFPRCEDDRVFDYAWPYLWKHSLLSLRWGQIDRFALLLNDVSPGGEVSCRLGPVKALHTSPSTLVNPRVTINGASVTFPGTLSGDSYLEFTEEGKCRFFDPNGFLLGEVEPECDRPVLLGSGTNEIEFSCEAGSTQGQAVWITVIAEGERLE